MNSSAHSSLHSDSPHHIIFLRVNLQDNDNDYYFARIQRWLERIGYNVTIFQSKTRKTIWDHKYIRPFIPDCVFKHFRSLNFFLRTVIKSIQALIFMQSPKDYIIFTDANCIALPILYLEPCKIIHFQFYQEIFSGEPQENLTIAWLSQWFLNFAETIVVPSDAVTSLIGHKIRHKVCLYVPAITVLRSRLYTYNKIRKIIKNKFIFLSVGTWQKGSNFELIVNSFFNLVSKLNNDRRNQKPWKEETCDTLMEQLHLIIAGPTSNSWSEYRYYLKIKYLVNSHPYRSHVSILQNIDWCTKCVFYDACVAVLNASRDIHFNRFLLEAQYFAKPIICVRNSFTVNYIKHGISGYLFDENHDALLNLMYMMLDKHNFYSFVGYYSHQNYKKLFESVDFYDNIDSLLSENNNISSGSWKKNSSFVCFTSDFGV